MKLRTSVLHQNNCIAVFSALVHHLGDRVREEQTLARSCGGPQSQNFLCAWCEAMFDLEQPYHSMINQVISRQSRLPECSINIRSKP